MEKERGMRGGTDSQRKVRERMQKKKEAKEALQRQKIQAALKNVRNYALGEGEEPMDAKEAKEG